MSNMKKNLIILNIKSEILHYDFTAKRKIKKIKES